MRLCSPEQAPGLRSPALLSNSSCAQAGDAYWPLQSCKARQALTPCQKPCLLAQFGCATTPDTRLHGCRRLQDPVISDIEQRLATWTMLNISHQEDMQV